MNVSMEMLALCKTLFTIFYESYFDKDLFTETTTTAITTTTTKTTTRIQLSETESFSTLTWPTCMYLQRNRFQHYLFKG